MEIFSQIYGQGDITFLTLVVDVFLGLFLSMVACYVYRITFRGITYSQTFLISLIMITIVTSVLISVIGSNLARAFSLVGALSIIRYRTAIKDARDTGFIFLCVATGMIIGAGYYALALGMMFFMSVLLVVLDKINFACDVVHRNVVKVILSVSKDPQVFENKIKEALNSAYRHVSLIEQHVDKTKNQVYLTFIGTLLDSKRNQEKQEQRKQRVIQQIKEISGVEQVIFVNDHLQQNI